MAAKDVVLRYLDAVENKTRYELRAPNGLAFTSHVAEIFEARDGKIQSFGIYFDRAPYPKPPATKS